MTTAVFDTYDGGKGGSYWSIIKHIPPHSTYVEPFLGGGAIWRNMYAADRSVGIDVDPLVIDAWCSHAESRVHRATSFPAWRDDNDDSGVVVDHAKASASLEQFICTDSIEWLASADLTPDTFIYVDPPYLFSERRQQRDLYRYELREPDHIRLLTVLRSLDCMVMISGYQSELYDALLTEWHKTTFTTNDRGGNLRTETLWCNYQLPPPRLHDSRYAGDGWRERQRIQRKAKRRTAGLWALPAHERQAVLDSMVDSGLIDWLLKPRQIKRVRPNNAEMARLTGR